MVFENTKIKNNAYITESILLPNVTIGNNALIQRAIIDHDCCIPDNFKIGVDLREDLKRGFRVSNDGIVVVTQKMLDVLPAKSAKYVSIQPANRATMFQAGVLHENFTIGVRESGDSPQIKVKGSLLQ